MGVIWGNKLPEPSSFMPGGCLDAADIDAINGNFEPGKILRFGQDEILQSCPDKPYSIKSSMEMTEEMKNKVPDIVKLVLSEIGQFL